MKNLFILIILIVITLVNFSCKREKIIYQTIKGEVFNLCNDSTVANVPVYLMGGKNDIAFKIKTYSNTGGTFEFKNVELRESYSYALYIPTSLDTIDMYHQHVEFLGGGCTKYFTINEAYNYHILKVDPFSLWGITFKCNSCNSITSPDSLSVYLWQPIVKKNMPDAPYFVRIKTTPSYNPFYNDFKTGRLRMGKWMIEIHKYKGGAYTFLKDSIYLPYWGQNTYIINW